MIPTALALVAAFDADKRRRNKATRMWHERAQAARKTIERSAGYGVDYVSRPLTSLSDFYLSQLLRLWEASK